MASKTSSVDPTIRVMFICFADLGDGEYAEGKSLVDENDVPLVHHSAEMAKYQSYVAEKESETSRDSEEAMQDRVASFGSWAAMVDWDDDGDLDMLIGTFMGKLFLRTNIGSRSNPAYTADSQQVESDGSPLKEDSHTNPVVADWDGDGLWDLVVGAGNGSVSWYRNVGTKKQPQFGPRNELVGAADKSIFLLQYLSEGEQPMPGTRAQICVTDYNGDGMLDLVVGDHSNIYDKSNLGAAETKQLDQLVAKQQELFKPITDLQNQYAKLYEEDPEAAKASDIQAKLESYYEELKPIGTAIEEHFGGESRSASFIWLYARKSTE